ncbi:hypothetical protein EVAR_52880_1 [Eumeta japonica]|uniref:Uncharacterized protein n=1 Tax=Eumeta variegata TaxID=151549 RepID=A0A4C1YJ36_EUMVA|nr:hypothetical protein EVAR_52880_1 [Eumeta japonica]
MATEQPRFSLHCISLLRRVPGTPTHSLCTLQNERPQTVIAREHSRGGAGAGSERSGFDSPNWRRSAGVTCGAAAPPPGLTH